MIDQAFDETHTRKTRLHSSVDECKPWIPATGITDVDVLWLPVSGFPLRHEERYWLLVFLQRLSAGLRERDGLREEVFLRFSAASGSLAETFNQYAKRVQILPGLTRRPGESLQGNPDMETVKEEIKHTDAFDLQKWTSDYAVWFQLKRAQEQRELFFGAGGMSLLFLPPDPATQTPRTPFTPKYKAALPVFQHFDVEEMLEGVMALNDRFLAHSKQVFGAGLEATIDMKSVGFVLPSLESRHFVQATPETRAQWFSVFSVYCRESVEDRGVLLSLKQEHRPTLLATLKSLETEHLHYPLEVTQ